MIVAPFSALEASQWYATLPKVALSANALLRDAEGRVALVRNTYRDGWSLPGGVVDDNEAPAAACVRELEEELGFKVERLGALLSVQWAERLPGSEIQFLSLTFDAGLCPDPAALRPQPEEIAEIGFFPIAALPPDTRPFMARRQRAIATAAQGAAAPAEAAEAWGPGIVYLEEGAGAFSHPAHAAVGPSEGADD